MEITYHQITFDEYLTAKQEIKEELLNMSGSFIRIGCRLKQIRESEAYKNDGYQTLAEFARAEYGLSESVTSRFMAINTKFSVGGNSMELLPEFQNFGSGKLSEMLTLSDEDCRLIKETTTVATIREVKRFNKDGGEETIEADVVTETGEPEEKQAEAGEKPETLTEETVPLATSQEWTGIKQVIVEFFRDKEELLNDIYKLGNCEDIAERMNPSGNLTFKKGLHMLFLYPYSEGVALKTFKQPNEAYTWPEFVKMMSEVFESAYTAQGKIWENFYGAEQTQEKEQKKAEENAVSPKQIKENCSSKEMERQAQIEDYFDKNGDYQIPEKEPIHKKENPKLSIHSLTGRVRLYFDNVEIAQGECIDEILWQIDTKISTMVADGYNAEITFSKEG